MQLFLEHKTFRADFRCEYCRAPEQVFNFAFEVEHIFPRSAGGDDSMDNLALACESCNLFKADSTTGWDEVESRETVLFHPRRDLWDAHFVYDHEAAEIRGSSTIGRATVARLKMNSNFQKRARRQRVLLNLYP